MHFEIVENRIRAGAFEPVSIEDAKVYFRSEESDGIEDTLIQRLISTARETIEKMTNLSLIDREIELYLEDWKGFIPYGPIDELVTSKDITIKGKSFPYIETAGDVTINYTTSAKHSKDLKSAILELAFYWYERGEFTGGEVPEKIMPVINNNRRIFGI